MILRFRILGSNPWPPNNYKPLKIQTIIPHLVPASTGHAACLVLKSPSPWEYKFIQKAAVPFSGQRDSFSSGNTVAPPCSTSLIYHKKSINIKHIFSSSLFYCLPGCPPKNYFKMNPQCWVSWWFFRKFQIINNNFVPSTTFQSLRLIFCMNRRLFIIWLIVYTKHLVINNVLADIFSVYVYMYSLLLQQFEQQMSQHSTT